MLHALGEPAGMAEGGLILGVRGEGKEIPRVVPAHQSPRHANPVGIVQIGNFGRSTRVVGYVRGSAFQGASTSSQSLDGLTPETGR